LMTRFAAQRRVFYVEEPVWTVGVEKMEACKQDSGVVVVVPHFREGQTEEEVNAKLTKLLARFFTKQQIVSYCLWYYTPMAMSWTAGLRPLATVYDCMDELSAFKNAHQDLKRRELELFERADMVFTGGQSLYEAKRRQHSNVFAFPSSIDVRHFASSRTEFADPEDQAMVGRPRLGFCGVIDERMDLELLAAVAEARPEWNLVMVGPVVKVDPASLPKHKNIHYLGMKSYQEIPRYIAGWDVAMLPFARNESTRFISPTKTPEYLAAGRPVVSTSIPDVVRPYGVSGLVRIADKPHEFITAVEAAILEDPRHRLQKVDQMLSQTSWSHTWGRMSELLEDAVEEKLYQPPRAYAAAAGR
jgi:UDP-galactopyranose mutase